MRLHMIRHGLTPSNLGHRFNDHADEPLHPSALEALATIRFDASGYDRIDVSPMRRAIATAEGLKLPRWTLEPRITERGLGVFQGLTAAECEARHGEAFAAFGRFEAEPAIPEGESRAEHLARVQSWLADVGASGAAQALAVTHGGVIDFVYRLASGAPLHGGIGERGIMGGDNLSLTEIEMTAERLELVAFARPL